MSAETVDRITRATVLLRVTTADGREISGTGFFGVPDAGNVVLTNAHVVGMLTPESRAPKRVEVVLNAGQKDQRKLGARVLGVDRTTGLAVLDVGRSRGMPEPLAVGPAREVSGGQKVHLFGFPPDGQADQELAIRDSTVSALERGAGGMDRIGIAGGLDEGNSGGPVVDARGAVLGVAVSGIAGLRTHHAIPGEQIQAVVAGRASVRDVGVPFTQDGRLGVPVTMQVTDPRQRVAEVGLDVWVGPRGSGSRPPSDAKPAVEPGDTPHQRVSLRYDRLAGEATADVLLPPLDGDQAYWIQPTWKYRAGGERWATAAAHTLPKEPPVERQPADLTVRFRAGASRNITLSVETHLHLGPGEDRELATLKEEATLREQTVRGSTRGATIKLTYTQARREVVREAGSRPDPRFQNAQTLLERFLTGYLITDPSGNPVQNVVDLNLLRKAPNPENLALVHAPIQAALSATAVSLPNGEVAPGKSWGGQRVLPILLPQRDWIGKLDLTYTYLGKRTREGREEAVLEVRGKVEGDGKDSQLDGTVRGQVFVDLNTGLPSRADMEAVVDVPVDLADLGGPSKKVQALATVQVVLKRPI